MMGDEDLRFEEESKQHEDDIIESKHSSFRFSELEDELQIDSYGNQIYEFNQEVQLLFSLLIGYNKHLSNRNQLRT